MNSRLSLLIDDALSKLSSRTNTVVFSDEEIKSLLLQFPPSFCLGNCAPYIFDVASGMFLYMGKNIQILTGIAAEEMMNLKMAESFPRYIDEKDGLILSRMNAEAFELLATNYNGRTDIQVNIDFGAVKTSGEKRRLLVQFRPIKWDEMGNLVITGGYFTDITHLKRAGFPVVTINHDGEILHMFEPSDKELVREHLTDFTLRELQLLRMIEKGDTTDEIAAQTGLTKATIYAHRRNIVAKSEFESIYKLIDSLKQSGVF